MSLFLQNAGGPPACISSLELVITDAASNATVDQLQLPVRDPLAPRTTVRYKPPPAAAARLLNSSALEFAVTALSGGRRGPPLALGSWRVAPAPSGGGRLAFCHAAAPKAPFISAVRAADAESDAAAPQALAPAALLIDLKPGYGGNACVTSYMLQLLVEGNSSAPPAPLPGCATAAVDAARAEAARIECRDPAALAAAFAAAPGGSLWVEVRATPLFGRPAGAPGIRQESLSLAPAPSGGGAAAGRLRVYGQNPRLGASQGYSSVAHAKLQGVYRQQANAWLAAAMESAARRPGGACRRGDGSLC